MHGGSFPDGPLRPALLLVACFSFHDKMVLLKSCNELFFRLSVVIAWIVGSYQRTGAHGVATQRTSMDNFTVIRTSRLTDSEAVPCSMHRTL
jgi:hypothetical protein